jgi:hypothetical protein
VIFSTHKIEGERRYDDIDKKINFFHSRIRQLVVYLKERERERHEKKNPRNEHEHSEQMPLPEIEFIFLFFELALAAFFPVLHTLFIYNIMS